jgi:hypothetical protein
MLTGDVEIDGETRHHVLMLVRRQALTRHLLVLQ